MTAEAKTSLMSALRTSLKSKLSCYKKWGGDPVFKS